MYNSEPLQPYQEKPIIEIGLSMKAFWRDRLSKAVKAMTYPGVSQWNGASLVPHPSQQAAA